MRHISSFSLIIVVAVVTYPRHTTGQFHFSGIVQHVKSVVFNTNFYQKVNSREISANGRSDVEINLKENAMGLPTNKTPLGVTNLPTEDNGNGKNINYSLETGPIETSAIRIIKENTNRGDDDDEDDEDGEVANLIQDSKPPEEMDNKATLTDAEEELLDFGYPLDFSFNETRQQWEEDLISAPGCPVSGEMFGVVPNPQNRRAWVHYGNPPRCYLIGTQGPCPLEMKLAAQRNSTFGVCKCDCFFKLDETKFDETKYLYDYTLDPYLDNSSPYCYDGAEHFAFFKDTCYSLLSRGPCKPGEVLLWDSQARQPACVPRECREHKIDGYQRKKEGFRFLVNRVCRKVGDPCILDDKYSQSQMGSYAIDINSTYPSCKVIEVDIRGTSVYVEPTTRDCANLNQKFSRRLKTCVSVLRSQRGRIG